MCPHEYCNVKLPQTTGTGVPNNNTVCPSCVPRAAAEPKGRTTFNQASVGISSTALGSSSMHKHRGEANK